MLYESDKWADSTISDVFKVFLEHIVQNSKRCYSHTRALVSREIRGSALHSRTFSISRSTLPTVNKIRLSQRKSKEHFQSCSKASRYPLIVLSWNEARIWSVGSFPSGHFNNHREVKTWARSSYRSEFCFLLISHSAESEDGADDFLPHLNDVVVEVALTSGATKFPTKFTLHTFFLINRILPTLNIKLKKWKPTNFGSIFCSREDIRDQTYLNSIQTR